MKTGSLSEVCNLLRTTVSSRKKFITTGYQLKVGLCIHVVRCLDLTKKLNIVYKVGQNLSFPFGEMTYTS